MIFNVKFDDPFLVSGTIDRLKYYTERNGPVMNPDYYKARRDRSYLNTPVFMPLEIKAGTYNDDTGKPQKYDGMFLDTALVTVSQERSIEETKVVGRSGTIKEYIADGDFEIAIKTILTTDNADEHPDTAAGDLIRLTRIPAPLTVVSKFLSLFDITQIVVKKITTVQKPGFQNVFAMDITASSYRPLELRIIDEKS